MISNQTRAILKKWIPPIICEFIRSKKGNSFDFKGVYNSWGEALVGCGGYDSNSIFDKVLEAALMVKSGEAVYERDSVLFDEVQFSWPVTASLMWSAAQNNGHLNVLDFGGALGSSYFENREFLTNLKHVTWSIVEQKHYVNGGRQFIADSRLSFYESLEECRHLKPNVVLLSSVLQYLEKPYEILDELYRLEADLLIIDKTIINKSNTDSIYIQKVPSHIYSASYPCRSFSENQLLVHMSSSFRLLSKFESLDFKELKQINSKLAGYIMVKK